MTAVFNLLLLTSNIHFLGVNGFVFDSSPPRSFRNQGQREIIRVLQGSPISSASAEYHKEKKVRRKAKVYKHLFRHYDDVSFDSWLRCAEPVQFLRSVGYTAPQIEQLAQEYPRLLTLNVHNHLAAKVRFLVETLNGGEGDLTWVNTAMVDGIVTNGEEEECAVLLDDEDEPIPHSMRLSEHTKSVVPASFYGCLLDRSLGPRHAYLVHGNLPHGETLLEQEGKLFQEFLLSTEKLSDFVDLCSKWAVDTTRGAIHTPDRIEAFERAFCQGLIPASKAGMTNHLNDVEDCTPERMVKLLVQHGANYLEKDRNGVSPLHWAAGTGNAGGVKTLVEAHLDSMPTGDDEDRHTDLILNEQGAKHGATPLHWATCGVSPYEVGFGGTYCIVYSLGTCPSAAEAKNLPESYLQALSMFVASY